MIFKPFFISLFLSFFLFPLSATAQESKDFSTVKSILFRQQADWNKGDIDAFMNGYWESDKLKFVGAAGITYGYAATLKNYHRRYPDRATMGQLTFGVKSMEKLSRKVIMLVGTWDLDRESGPIGGYFTLMWKKIKGEWVVVADHTSARK